MLLSELKLFKNYNIIINDIKNELIDYIPYDMANIIVCYLKVNNIFRIQISIFNHGFNPNKTIHLDFKNNYIYNQQTFIARKIAYSKYGRGKFSFFINGHVNNDIINQIKLLENNCRELLSYTGCKIKVKSVATACTINCKINTESREYNSLNGHLPYQSDWDGKTLVDTNYIELTSGRNIIIGKQININLKITGIIIKKKIAKLLLFICD